MRRNYIRTAECFLRGEARPPHNRFAAMHAISALSCVAAVSAFSAQTPLLRVPGFATTTAASDEVRRRAHHGNFCFLPQQQRRHQRTPTCTCRMLQHGLADNGAALMTRGGGQKPDVVKEHGIYDRVASFLNKRFFLLGAAAMVIAARLAPAVGATGGLLRPELTVNKAGESIILYYLWCSDQRW